MAEIVTYYCATCSAVLRGRQLVDVHVLAHRPPKAHHVLVAVDQDGTERYVTGRITSADGPTHIAEYISLANVSWPVADALAQEHT